MNITTVQLSIAVIGLFLTIVMTGWRITRGTKKDIDEKISKKLNTEVFEAYRLDNREAHARFEQDIRTVEKNHSELQKEMSGKLDQIYKILIEKL